MKINALYVAMGKLWLSPKTILVMKLTTLMLFLAFLQCSAKVFSQQVSLNETNAPLKKVFKAINKQTGYVFFYESKTVRNKTLTIDIKDVPLTEALKQCFKNQSLSYEIINNTVFVKEEDIRQTQPTSTIQNIASLTVTGVVNDERNVPLPGVTVKLKGSNLAVITNSNGKFRIDIPDGNGYLVFSFVGYITQEARISPDIAMNIQMQLDQSKLSEVVVVGYGTQKKADLSGSVSSVAGRTLTERPATNIQNLLQGRIAGLTVVQPTGEPGFDQGSLQVRGLGSYGASSSPLILIDGIVGTLGNLAPQDIDNVTVLKDAASASIYGSRAANGVILVTTKRGKLGTNSISYDNSFGTTSATTLPKFITNSVTYMQMYNQAVARSGQPAIYTQAQIDAYKNGNGSIQYPNMDWLKYYFHTAPMQNHNLSFAGGDSVSTYYASAGYQNQKGITDGYNYNRYNSNLNYTRKVNKVVNIGTNVNFSYQNVLSPIFLNDDAILLAYAQAPTYGPTLPDGSGRIAVRDYIENGTGNRTLYERQNNGKQIRNYYNVNAQGYLNLKIIRGLDWKTTGAFVFYNQDYKYREYKQPFDVYAYQPDANGNYQTVQHPLISSLYQYSERNLTLTVNSTFNYEKDFGANHHFNALAGYEQISNKSTFISGSRTNFSNDAINELSGGPTTGWGNDGNATEYALQSLFGRVNYNYKSKYFLQGNIRYDGTSRVDQKYRWGTFGGGSAAWRISEEEFLKNNLSWLDNLKLRGSYGVLGNQEIPNYPYQQILNNTQYPFSNNLSSGVSLNALTQANLQWEKTAITDIGLDINIFKGLLGATVDYYYKKTTGILAQSADLPASVGLSPPIINAGALVNNGFEFQLTHENRIGEFTYGANVIFSLNRNKVTKVLAPNPGVFQVGLPYNSFYVYQWIGIFNSQQEIDSSPKQPNSGLLKPGDLKIKDVNGNGVIDPGDRISVSPFPAYTYSFGVNAGYKSFRLSAFFQGVQGQKFYVSGWGIDPFLQSTAPTTEFLNAWTPQNLSQTVPAVYANGYPGVDGYNSTYFLRDASYLRLKNVNLSYTFQTNVLKTLKLKGLAVFVSADNAITWTKYKGADPERSGSGRYAQYPQLKTYSAGLKVSL